MAYSISLRPSVSRDFRKLSGDVMSRIQAAIGRLVNDPRPAGSRKLIGFDDEWRIRVGSYRILYTIDDSKRQVTIARIAHRRESYR